MEQIRRRGNFQSQRSLKSMKLGLKKDLSLDIFYGISETGEIFKEIYCGRFLHGGQIKAIWQNKVLYVEL